MNDRRRMLGFSVALGVASLSGLSHATRITGGPGSGGLAARLQKRRPLNLHAGSHGGHEAPGAIHVNFSRLLEYNFAVLDDRRFTALWRALSSEELVLLAPLYDASARDSGIAPRLLELLAERADNDTLLRVASAFGHERVLEAVAAVAPAKLGPLADAAPIHGARGTELGATDPTSLSMLDYTLYEIYLSYRTAPIGALGVRAALYEATRYSSMHLAAAWGGGYTLGKFVVAPLIRHFAPSLWDAIGATVHHTVEVLSHTYDAVTTARHEREAASLFDMDPQPYWQLQTTGGDYGVVWNWHVVYGGGSGGGGGGGICGPLTFCPPMDMH